jgi:hypothetical protein
LPFLAAAQTCVMSMHKNDLARMSTRRLLARRRALAARLAGAEHVLVGSLVEQVAARVGIPVARVSRFEGCDVCALGCP